MRPQRPSLRSSLIRIHRVILKIEVERWGINQQPRLTKLEKMVLLLEDRRFFEHAGVDWFSVVREVQRLLVRKRHGGASTIDMQLFRTVSDRYERTMRRKVREWFGTALLQRKFTKLEILRIYLGVAYFGTGLRGVLEAAKALFPDVIAPYAWQLEDEDLTLDQAAQIAALLVYPKPRIPDINWQAKVRRRANYGLALYARREKKFDEILR